MLRKQLLSYAIIVFVSLGVVSTANAALVNTDDPNVIYDNVTNKWWFANLPIFTGLDFSEQQDQIDFFNSSRLHTPDGCGDFRFATRSELEALLNYSIGDLFRFIPVETGPIWFGLGIITDYRGLYEDGDGNPYTLAGASVTIYRSFYIYFNPNTGSSRIKEEVTKSPPYFTTSPASWVPLGAWVVAEARSEVPLPASIWFLGVGLSALVSLRKIYKK